MLLQSCTTNYLPGMRTKEISAVHRGTDFFLKCKEKTFQFFSHLNLALAHQPNRLVSSYLASVWVLYFIYVSPNIELVWIGFGHLILNRSQYFDQNLIGLELRKSFPSWNLNSRFFSGTKVGV